MVKFVTSFGISTLYLAQSALENSGHIIFMTALLTYTPFLILFGNANLYVR